MAEGKLMTCLAGLVCFSACARQLAEWISVSVRNSVLSSVPFLSQLQRWGGSFCCCCLFCFCWTASTVGPQYNQQMGPSELLLNRTYSKSVFECHRNMTLSLIVLCLALCVSYICHEQGGVCSQSVYIYDMFIDKTSACLILGGEDKTDWLTSSKVWSKKKEKLWLLEY